MLTGWRHDAAEGVQICLSSSEICLNFNGRHPLGLNTIDDIILCTTNCTLHASQFEFESIENNQNEFLSIKWRHYEPEARNLKLKCPF
jgi:hypothetical protein